MSPPPADDAFVRQPLAGVAVPVGDGGGIAVRDSPRFPVRFDEEPFVEDLAHASAAGRAVGERERRRPEDAGITPNELRV